MSEKKPKLYLYRLLSLKYVDKQNRTLFYISTQKHGHNAPLSSISRKFDGVPDSWNVSYMLTNKTELYFMFPFRSMVTLYRLAQSGGSMMVYQTL